MPPNSMRAASALPHRPSPPPLFIGQLIEIRTQFVIEILLHATARKEISAETCQTAKQWHDGSTCFECACNSQRNGFPLTRFSLQLPASGRGQTIKLGASIVLRVPPGRSQPPGFLHAVQRGKQRTGLHLKRAVGDLCDAMRNRQSMQLSQASAFRIRRSSVP